MSPCWNTYPKSAVLPSDISSGGRSRFRLKVPLSTVLKRKTFIGGILKFCAAFHLLLIPDVMILFDENAYRYV